MLSKVLAVLALIASVGVASAVPTVAHACKCTPHLDLVSSLRDAHDVPVDVAPVIRGFSDPATITWSTLEGVAVPFELRHGHGEDLCRGQIGELRARVALAPNTTYVIGARIDRGLRGELRFTTGSGRVPDLPLSAPALTVTLVHRLIYDSCVTEVNGCLAVGDVDTEVILRDAQDRELGWFITRGAQHLERVQGEPACVEARTRDAAGRRSEAVKLCGPDLPIRPAQESDYEDFWLRCDEGRLPPPSLPVDAGEDTGSEPADDGGSEADVALRPSEHPRLDASAEGCSVSGAADGRAAWMLLLFLFCGRRRVR